MLPILFRTPWFFVYSYTAVYILAILAGLIVTRRMEPMTDWIDGYLVTFAAALVGGRIGFVVTEWGYFRERPFSLQNLWHGGFNYHAALLAGFVGVWVWCWWGKRPLRLTTPVAAQCRPFSHTLTLFAPSFALIHSFGWLACWLEGCGYGAETVFREGILSLFVGDLPDSFGIFAIRYQTQWLGFAYSLLVFSIALRPKTKFWHVLFWISLGRVSLAFLRGDPAYQIGLFRLDVLFDIALALTSLILLQYTSYEIKNRSRTNSSSPR